MSGIEDRIVEYLREHKSSDGNGIKSGVMALNLKIDRAQLDRALYRLLAKDNPEIIRVKHGRYAHIENVPIEKRPPAKKETAPNNPGDIDATLGGPDGGGCSISFFIHIISHLSMHHGDRQINQSEFKKLADLLGNVEDLYLSLRPKNRVLIIGV